jgi:hypothetical protein
MAGQPTRITPHHTTTHEEHTLNIQTAFPSQFLRAADLDGKPVNLTIEKVVMEEVGQGADADTKPCVYFTDSPYKYKNGTKGWILNVTNSKMIAAYYGDDTDNWIGKPVQVYPDKVQFGANIVDAIRVRIVASSPPAPVPEDDGSPF